MILEHVTEVSITDPRRISRHFVATEQQLLTAYRRIFGADPADNARISSIGSALVDRLGFAAAALYTRRQCRIETADRPAYWMLESNS